MAVHCHVVPDDEISDTAMLGCGSWSQGPISVYRDDRETERWRRTRGRRQIRATGTGFIVVKT